MTIATARTARRPSRLVGELFFISIVFRFKVFFIFFYFTMMCTRVCVCGFCPLFFFFPSAHNLIARRRPARIFEYGNIFRKRFEPYPCIEEVIFLIFFVKKPGINRRKNRNMYDDGFVIFSIYFLFVATRLKNKRGNPEHSHGKLTLGSSVRGRVFKIF